MTKYIVAVDDERDILNLVLINLKKSGFEVKGFCEGGPLFRSLRSRIPDLIILDLMLPDMDGFEICKQLKTDSRYSAIPVIMLTAKSHEADKVIGLELGADDYITKPFSPRELVARIKAVLRRVEQKTESKAIAICGVIKIDPEKFEVSVEGKRIVLTATEFKILELLGKKPGTVFSRDEILENLWGDEKIVVDRTIDVHIRHLREKLGKSSKLIKNIRSMGYKIEEE